MASEIKFYGVNETLFYLKNYEKELFDQFKKKLADAAQPLADLVGSRFPSSPPLQNWHSSGGRVGVKRLPAYRASTKTVQAKSGGFVRKTAKGGYGILRIQQMDGGGQVYDSAGIGTYESKGSTLINNLDKHTKVKSKRGTTRSRIMYGAVKNNQAMVEEAVLKVVKEVDGYTTKRINDPRSR
jgi:hypothetical protein